MDNSCKFARQLRRKLSCAGEEDEEEPLLEELGGRAKTSRRLLGYSRNKILGDDVNHRDIAEDVGSRWAENDLSLSHRLRRRAWGHFHHRHVGWTITNSYFTSVGQ